MGLKFEWHKKKANTNLKKHGISFDEASTVFNDPLAEIFDDEEHSTDEDREFIIGHSILQRLIIVFFTERTKNIIRIFSARKASKKERRKYEKNRRT